MPSHNNIRPKQFFYSLPLPHYTLILEESRHPSKEEGGAKK
jgi:hypothetical protein